MQTRSDSTRPLLSPTVALLTLTALSGCADPFSPGEALALAEAEARWQAARPSAYSFELRISCVLCSNSLQVFTTLEIRADTVAAATPIDPPAQLPTVPLREWLTVPQLFARLHEIANSANAGGRVEDVSASYDPHYGYPIRISVRCSGNITDCGELTEARNLQPLP